MTQNIDVTIEKEINNLISESKPNKKILIFSGGGTRGIAYFGVLKALSESSILDNIEIFAATSVGGMILSLYLAGYTVKELEDFYELFDFNNLTTISDYNLDNIHDLIKKYGIDDGSNITKVIGKLLEAKKINKDITLLELYKMNKKKFVVTGCCLETHSVEYISYETYPNMKLTDAVRITTAVPLYFQPLKYNNKTFVDGGCMDNYPINLFTDRLEEVIGVYLYTDITTTNINNLKDFLMSFINAYNKGYTLNIMRGWEKVTIVININQDILNFNINIEERKQLFNIGYNTTIGFINHHHLHN